MRVAEALQCSHGPVGPRNVSDWWPFIHEVFIRTFDKGRLVTHPCALFAWASGVEVAVQQTFLD